MKDLSLKGKGEVVTYTIIHVAPENFEEQVPYPIAIIKLDEGPQVTGQIVDCDIKDVKIGMRVESTFRKIQDEGYTGLSFLLEGYGERIFEFDNLLLRAPIP